MIHDHIESYHVFVLNLFRILSCLGVIFDFSMRFLNPSWIDLSRWILNLLNSLDFGNFEFLSNWSWKVWISFSHCNSRSRVNRGFKWKLAVDFAATCHRSIRLQSIIYLTIWLLLGFMCSSSIRLTFSAHTADSSWIHLLYGRSLIVVETLAQVYLHFCKMVQYSIWHL